MSIARRRLLLWSLLALLLAGALAFAFWPRPVPVDLAVARLQPMTVTLDEEGETRIRDIYELSAPVPGRLLRIELDPGDAVVANETIVATIEPVDPAFLDFRTEAEREAAVRAAAAGLDLATAEVERAKAELVFASRELERARGLEPGRTITQRAVDQAERVYETSLAALQTAEAERAVRAFELERARAQTLSPVDTLEQRQSCVCIPVFAPVSGEVLRVLQESEGVVEAGRPLVEIGDPADLEIVADYLSADAVKIEAGQRVIVDEWGGSAPLQGRVHRVEPYGFMKVSALGIEEQRVNVVVRFDGSPDERRRLAHGYRVETRVVLWQSEAVLSVPVTALFRTDDGWALFVEEAGRARLTRVELGHASGLQREIVAGLDEGARVVLHPSDRVADGTRIVARR